VTRADSDPGDVPMLELFRVECENQAAVLTSGLLELERKPAAPALLETLMRAAHSLKGAARIVNVQAAVDVAHAMEDLFVLAQAGTLVLRQAEIDLLFRGIDLLLQVAKLSDPGATPLDEARAKEVEIFVASLADVKARRAQATPPAEASSTLVGALEPTPSALEPGAQPILAPNPPVPERVVRLTAENLNRLLGLAGESLVESRWLRPFSNALQRLKRQQSELSDRLEGLRHHLGEGELSPRVEHQLDELAREMSRGQQLLEDRLQELDLFDRRSAQLSQRMYLEVLRTRMRPFGDGVSRFPRMVRDLARSLGKDVRLEVTGENTPVDRDVLERLESPLAHLLRNAVDHGCESPAERQAAGKPPQGTIRLDARHSAGMLVITVTDDGPGVALQRVRETVLQQRLTSPTAADSLSEAELLQFLVRPGFTLKDTVTEISGRGVGLDVVQNMVRAVRGSLRLGTQEGHGLRVQLQLPLTLSVLRALLVEVAGEPYAFPLGQITRAVKLRREMIEVVENRHHFHLAGQQIGLVATHQVFDYGEIKLPANDLPVVVLGDRHTRYGLVVDRFLGERELVVHPLDTRLGKVKDISAAALMEDGSPVLIVDVDEMLQSVRTLVAEHPLEGFAPNRLELGRRPQKRVLAVDDSLTVRELVRKLLTSHGYAADVAVDGMDAWSAVQAGSYDLVITDVDMPRLDGIELAALIKKDARLRSVPVMVVSYKESQEDRMRGLEAGADYYITKGAFHDETLLQAVVDLIGEAQG
jgi:two-component system, chemotaxis family, sensor histidine kinase and response regulator WspE